MNSEDKARAVKPHQSNRASRRATGSRTLTIFAWLAAALSSVGCNGSFNASMSGSSLFPTAPSKAPTPPNAGPIPALAGRWSATGYTCPDNSAPPREDVEIAQSGAAVTATKLTGDNCVAVSSVTWRGTARGISFPVEVQVGTPQGQRSFVHGRIQLQGDSQFELLGPGWTVAFRRVTPSATSAGPVPAPPPASKSSSATHLAGAKKTCHNGLRKPVPCPTDDQFMCAREDYAWDSNGGPCDGDPSPEDRVYRD